MSVTVRRSGSRKLERILKNMQELQTQTIKVGFFEDSTYEDGTPVAYVASIHEFGYPAGNIPSRSFMRTTAKEQSAEWADLAGQAVTAVADGRLSAKTVGERLGGKAAGDVKKTISKIRTPPLKKSTIKARKRRLAKGGKTTKKGITKPLVDTGVLLAAVTFKVEG